MEKRTEAHAAEFAEVLESSLLTPRLVARALAPIGVIDVKQAQWHYARLVHWLAQRQTLLDYLNTRYGVSGDAQGAGENLTLAVARGELIAHEDVPASLPGAALPEMSAPSSFSQTHAAPRAVEQPGADAALSRFDYKPVIESDGPTVGPSETLRVSRRGRRVPSPAQPADESRPASGPQSPDAARSTDSPMPARADGPRQADARRAKPEERIGETASATRHEDAAGRATAPPGREFLSESRNAPDLPLAAQPFVGRGSSAGEEAGGAQPARPDMALAGPIESRERPERNRNETQAQAASLAVVSELAAPAHAGDEGPLPSARDGRASAPDSRAARRGPTRAGAGRTGLKAQGGALGAGASGAGDVEAGETFGVEADERDAVAGAASVHAGPIMSAGEIPPASALRSRAAMVWNRGAGQPLAAASPFDAGPFSSESAGHALSPVDSRGQSSQASATPLAGRSAAAEQGSASETQPARGLGGSEQGAPKAATVNVQQVAQQVSRMLSRRLLIERERRGMVK